ncbi:DUF2793 domain-containing protein [Rickettsia endosymbiont of Orchestes rusci]|uniref:DUF2793 domain-containing protein n=1 Tax=Rickettsia endosymbiont of Orchestes rusci TaxID=3066250 RepID=UPI00313ABD4C
MTYTNRLKLPLIHNGQAQKEITHNEALNMLDILVNSVIQEVNITSPPESPRPGQLYIVGLEPTGEFKNQSNKIAQRLDNSWRFVIPHKWLEVTHNKDGTKYRFTGKNWEQIDVSALSVTPVQVQNDYLIKKDSGEYLQVMHLEEDVKLSEEFTDTTIKIPHHTYVIAVNIRVLEEIQGCSSFSVGVAEDTKRYGNALTITKDTTNIGLTNHPLTYWHDTPIRLTADNNNFISGLVKITVQLLKPHGSWHWE